MQTDDPESPLGQRTPWTLGDRLLAAKAPASLGLAPRPARAKEKLAFADSAADELEADDEDAFDPARSEGEAMPPLPPLATSDEPELSEILNRLAALSEPKNPDGVLPPLPGAAPTSPPVAGQSAQPAPVQKGKSDRAIRVANLCLLVLCLVLSLRLFYENTPPDLRSEWMQRVEALQTTVADMIARRDEALRDAAVNAAPPLTAEVVPPQHKLAAEATAAPAAATPTSPESSKAAPAPASVADESKDIASAGPAATVRGTAAPTGNAPVATLFAKPRRPEPFAVETEGAPPAPPAQPSKPVIAAGPVEAAPADEKAENIAVQVPISPAATDAPNTVRNDISAVTPRARPQVDAAEIAALVKHGDDLLAIRDVAGARLFYERAGAAGSARGAISAGQTYDPVYLAKTDVRGIRPDRAKAIEWYGKALAQGETSAQAMIARLR